MMWSSTLNNFNTGNLLQACSSRPSAHGVDQGVNLLGEYPNSSSSSRVCSPSRALVLVLTSGVSDNRTQWPISRI